MTDAATPSGGTTPALLRAAWLAVLLGIAMEFLLLLVAFCFGRLPGVDNIIADIAQKVSWSSIVCLGLAIGVTASRGAAPAGLAGLLAAPLGFAVARSIHKGVSQALATGAVTPSGPSRLRWGDSPHHASAACSRNRWTRRQRARLPRRMFDRSLRRTSIAAQSLTRCFRVRTLAIIIPTKITIETQSLMTVPEQ